MKKKDKPKISRSELFVHFRTRNRPRVVCLCGTTKDLSLWTFQNQEHTLRGYIVLTIGVDKNRSEVTEAQKSMLDELHLRKIDLSDEIFVINPDGYVGESTRNEIIYAIALGKTINWLEDFVTIPSGNQLKGDSGKISTDGYVAQLKDFADQLFHLEATY